MLTVLRRQMRRRPHTSRKERRWQCPLAVEGTLNGARVRTWLGLRSFGATQNIVIETPQQKAYPYSEVVTQTLSGLPF
jgi:hypothetical protein